MYKITVTDMIAKEQTDEIFTKGAFAILFKDTKTGKIRMNGLGSNNDMKMFVRALQEGFEEFETRDNKDEIAALSEALNDLICSVDGKIDINIINNPCEIQDILNKLEKEG